MASRTYIIEQKAAKRAYDKARYAAMREKVIARSAAYYEANKEAVLSRRKTAYRVIRGAVLASQKARRAANIDKFREKEREASRRFRENNPDIARSRVLRSVQKSRAENPEKHRAASRSRYWSDPEKARLRAIQDGHLRRARKLRAGGKFTAADIYALRETQKGICAFCGTAFGDAKVHVDHWIPLARGGSNGPENLRLLHALCNLKKWAKVPPLNMENSCVI